MRKKGTKILLGVLVLVVVSALISFAFAQDMDQLEIDTANAVLKLLIRDNLIFMARKEIHDRSFSIRPPRSHFWSSFLLATFWEKLTGATYDVAEIPFGELQAKSLPI